MKGKKILDIAPQRYLCPQLVVKTKYIDSLIKLLLTYLLTSLRFSKTRELWSSKANRRLRSLLPSIILALLSENRNLLQWDDEVMVCDLWLVDFDPFCMFLCFKGYFLDRNYHARQRKTQLWRRLLNLGVHMLLKSAVNKILQDPFLWLVVSSNGQIIV